MKKKTNSRNSFVHLYNPEEEGLGSYDANYVNAYRKDKIIKAKFRNFRDERYAA